MSTFYHTGHLSVKKRVNFKNDLDQYLESLISLKGEDVLCGDFNIHVEMNHIDTTEFYSVTNSYGFEQLISEPTHQDGGTLDLLFLKQGGNLKELAEKSIYVHGLHCSLTSDHKFIECMLPFIKDFPKPEKVIQSYQN